MSGQGGNKGGNTNRQAQCPGGQYVSGMWYDYGNVINCIYATCSGGSSLWVGGGCNGYPATDNCNAKPYGPGGLGGCNIRSGTYIDAMQTLCTPVSN